MSTDVSTWLWKHSPHSGTALLLLLAIADNANKDGGGAYPGIKYLAEKARMSERNVHYLLDELVASGALLVAYKAGPHGVNVYTIVMKDAEAPCTVKPTAQCKAVHRETQRKKTLQSGAKTLKPVSEDPAIAIAPDPSLTVLLDPSLDPSVPSSPPVDTVGEEARSPLPLRPAEEVDARLDEILNKAGKALSKSKPAPKPSAKAGTKEPPDPRVTEILRTIEDELGYDIPFWPKEAASVKRMLNAGHEAQDILACWRALKREPFWADKWLALAKVAENIGEWKRKRSGGGPRRANDDPDKYVKGKFGHLVQR